MSGRRIDVERENAKCNRDGGSERAILPIGSAELSVRKCRCCVELFPKWLNSEESGLAGDETTLHVTTLAQ